MAFSDAQNDNAKRNSAKAVRKHHAHSAPDIDWDKCIANLQKMLDDIDKKYR